MKGKLSLRRSSLVGTRRRRSAASVESCEKRSTDLSSPQPFSTAARSPPIGSEWERNPLRPAALASA
eukprot:scaffold1097_cov246-Pinguiococcus_pyrenoidosus.AAC.3